MIEETKKIKISDYDYPLTDQRIAKYPLKERDQSKLLVYNKGNISQTHFNQLPAELPKNSLLIRNNTRVIQARLHFHKETGALIEVFCLEPAAPADYQLNFQMKGHTSWLCMIGNLKKWKQGTLTSHLTINGQDFTLTATRQQAVGTSHWIDFKWDKEDISWAEILEIYGELPIPPYLNRKTEESDKKTYQTVYAEIEGSVAAPTAGLHFTPEVFKALESQGVEIEEVTLHVGAGTFKPVKSANIEGHDMHTEYISVTRYTIDRLLAHQDKVIAVGTTSVRTLESLYYLGCKVHEGLDTDSKEMHVEQWEPYERKENPNKEEWPVTVVLQSLLDYMDKHELEVFHASTQIIIAPGYTYHIVKGMITNFHQPKSTLLLLVSAFVGEDWKKMYDFALQNEFRFLSYGDSSLLLP
ncbi:MAG: S-adenosylmethionine:tRNA ribosyltransferase-isomerase [Bacteroidaceae bacterium]